MKIARRLALFALFAVIAAGGLTLTTSDTEAGFPPKGDPFDCSLCEEAFCAGTAYCRLVDCVNFCDYACTWVICDPDILE